MTHPHGKHFIRGILNIVLVRKINDWWPFERFSEVFFIIIIIIILLNYYDFHY